MARLLAWLTLIAYTTATMQQGGGGGGLPFDLGSLGSLGNTKQGDGNQGKDKDKGMGMDMGMGLQQGGGKDGGGSGKTTVNLVLIWTNQGGDAQNQAMNEPAMEKGTVHNVTVGGDAGLVYTPDSVTAQPGDMIEFGFMSKNHTATQSTFDSPCSKMDSGFDSGFIPNPDNSVDPPPAMMFQVTTMDPVWMYCAQGTHCQKGMVFSVNPTADKSQEMFKQMAMASGDGGDGGGGAGGGAGGNMTGGGNMTAPQLAQPSIATGEGTQGDGGACSCACLCGKSAFPAGGGKEGWGGMSGSMSMSALGKRGIDF